MTLGIASGGMKGITFVQAFQYWLKIVALAVPALFLLRSPASAGVDGHRSAPPTFTHRTTVEFPQTQVITLTMAVYVEPSGPVDDVTRHGTVVLATGPHDVAWANARLPGRLARPALEAARS